MNTLDLLAAVGAAQDEYVREACFAEEKQRKGKIRFLLIAALIALLLLLVGCAAMFYRLEKLVMIDHTAETAETEYGPFVAEQVLSMQGYEGSPAYNALQEWLAYVTEYEHQHPEARFGTDFVRPDSYRLYICYSQEMVDKVDALCSKYGLHILGSASFLKNAAEMEEAGLTYVLSPDAVTRCFLGNLFEDGSFVADGELVLSGDYDRVVQFQMHRIRKDAFYTVSLGINGMDSYTQWNYKTEDGYQALMALNDTTGLIITDNKEYFITVIINEVPDANMVWHGLPEEKAFLEVICDCFRFSEE